MEFDLGGGRGEGGDDESKHLTPESNKRDETDSPEVGGATTRVTDDSFQVALGRVTIVVMSSQFCNRPHHHAGMAVGK